MTLPLLQVISLLFAVAMAYLTYVGFRRRQFGRAGLLFWEALWLGLLVASVVPLPRDWLSHALGAARLLDLAMVAAILLLSGITYRTYVVAQVTRRQLEELVRKQALAQLPSKPFGPAQSPSA